MSGKYINLGGEQPTSRAQTDLPPVDPDAWSGDVVNTLEVDPDGHLVASDAVLVPVADEGYPGRPIGPIPTLSHVQLLQQAGRVLRGAPENPIDNTHLTTGDSRQEEGGA